MRRFLKSMIKMEADLRQQDQLQEDYTKGKSEIKKGSYKSKEWI